MASRAETTNDLAADPCDVPLRQPERREGLIAAGGLLGALAASSCCILPLVLFSVGLGGAWIGNLTALAPYQPIFAAITLAFLAGGFYLVYLRPGRACAADEACARPLPNRIVKTSLWIATLLVAASSIPSFLSNDSNIIE